MSVINTMLKDLQKRETNYADNNEILLGLKSRAQPAPTNASNNNILLIAGLGFGLIVAVLVSIYFISPYQLVKAPTNNETLAVNNHTTIATTTAIPAENLSATETHSVPQPTTPVITITDTVERKAVPTKITNPIADTAAAKQQGSTTATVAALPVTTESDDTSLTSQPSLRKTPVLLTREEKSQQAYAAALTQYNQGQTQAAKYLLKDAVAIDPKNSQALHLLAAIHIFEQRPDIAVDVLEQGLTVNTNDMDLVRMYLQALVQTENYVKAISAMETYFTLTVPDDMAYLAGLYQKNNQHLAAVKYYSQALRLIPGNSIWWMGQAISLEALDQYQQATDSYHQALSTGRLSTQLNEFVKLRLTSLQNKPGLTP